MKTSNFISVASSHNDIYLQLSDWVKIATSCDLCGYIHLNPVPAGIIEQAEGLFI